MKKIAFIITVYKNDKLEFFKQAVESIVNQDYGFENINIYLGIDGDLSQDVQSYIDDSSDFYKVLQNEQNRGLAYTLNRLIEVLEDEEYIFRMDSDDICRKDRVSKQLEAFENDKELMILGSDLIEIDEKGKELREKKMPTDYEVIKRFAIARNPLNHPTVAIKRDFFNIVGLYNEEFLKSQDYELWGRALKKGVKISNVNESLLYFRVANDYMNKRNAFINYINEFKISIELMNHFKMYGQFPKVLAKLIIRMMPSSIGKLVYKKIRG
jgi:GT2 family glycosyltransferase